MKTATTGCILAGGQASRMHYQDKGLVLLNNQPLYYHVWQRLSPQVNSLIINANRNIEQYRQSGLPVLADSQPGFQGSLAGILTGLQHSPTEWMLFVPCDTPNVPLELLSQFWQQKENSRAIYARDPLRAHPTCVLLHRTLSTAVENFLLRGERKLRYFMEEISATSALFTDSMAFQNLNTLEDCRQWESGRSTASQ